MQYRPDLGEEETLGELKEEARNIDETRYIRDCYSTEEEGDHKNKNQRKKVDPVFRCERRTITKNCDIS
jgi:hypothetical protein